MTVCFYFTQWLQVAQYRASLPGRMTSPALAARIVIGIPFSRSIRVLSSGCCMIVMSSCSCFTVSLTANIVDISHIAA